jgi:hypothetical protein
MTPAGDRDPADGGLASEARLGQYAQTFAENEIDVFVLPHLTDQDFKEIWRSALGPQRKILAAITAETGTTNATPEPAASIEPKAQDTAERLLCSCSCSSSMPPAADSGSMPRYAGTILMCARAKARSDYSCIWWANAPVSAVARAAS